MPSKEFLNRPGSVWEKYNFMEQMKTKDRPQMRIEMDELLLSCFTCPEGVTITKGECGGIPGQWITPEKPQEMFMYYIHGGGFDLGSSTIPLPFLATLAEKAGIASFSVDYRLAPEYKFPDNIDDCLAAYKGLIEKYDPKHIVICGESAGGQLTMAIANYIHMEGLPMPAGLIPLSPLTDMRPTAVFSDVEDVVIDNMKGHPAEKPKAKVDDIYAPGADLSDPRLSPICGELAALPPTFFIAGGAEMLFPQATTMAEKMAEAGCDVRTLIGKDMIHTYPLDCLDYPEAMDAVEDIIVFISHLRRMATE